MMNKERHSNQKGHTTQKESMGILGTAHSSKETNMEELTLRDIVYGARDNVSSILRRTTEAYQQKVHGDDNELSNTIKHHGRWWKHDIKMTALEVLVQALKQACHLKSLKVLKITKQELLDYFLLDENLTEQTIDSKELKDYLYWAERHINIIHKVYTK